MEVLQVKPQTNEQRVIEPVSPSDLMRIIIGDGVASFAAIFSPGCSDGWSGVGCVATQLQGVGLQ